MHAYYCENFFAAGLRKAGSEPVVKATIIMPMPVHPAAQNGQLPGILKLDQTVSESFYSSNARVF